MMRHPIRVALFSAAALLAAIACSYLRSRPMPSAAMFDPRGKEATDISHALEGARSSLSPMALSTGSVEPLMHTMPGKCVVRDRPPPFTLPGVFTDNGPEEQVRREMPRVGRTWYCTFWTDGIVPPYNGPPVDPVWIIVGLDAAQATSLDHIGMPGCILRAALNQFLWCPVAVGWQGGWLLREPQSHHRIFIRWTPEPQHLGMWLTLQPMILSPQNPAGIVIGNAVQIRVGSPQ